MSKAGYEWCLYTLKDVLAELRKRESRVLDVERKTQIQEQIAAYAQRIAEIERNNRV